VVAGAIGRRSKRAVGMHVNGLYQLGVWAEPSFGHLRLIPPTLSSCVGIGPLRSGGEWPRATPKSAQKRSEMRNLGSAC